MGARSMRKGLDPLVASVEHRVTFSEVDALGAVHHSRAPVWFEMSREAYYRKFGVEFVRLSKAGFYLAVRKLSLQYDSFIGYDDLLRITCALTMIGRVHLDLHYRVDNLTTGVLAVHGSSNMVSVEQKEPGKLPVLGRLAFAREPFLPRVVKVEELLPELAVEGGDAG
jgi:YbgC/YbaW family acyl-CoA thioester hydrolase